MVEQTRPGWCNPNLLDNWYFVNPVNQRGQTTYSERGYTIDRVYAESGTLTLTDSGITFAGGVFVQRAEKDFSNKLIGTTVTISALSASGELFWQTGKLTQNETIAANFQGGYISVSYFPTENQFMRIAAPAVGITLTAAKLELGDTQTLAHKEGDDWVLNEIPDYGEQLAKCQRYQLVLSGYFQPGFVVANLVDQANAIICTPVSLRAKPTATFSGNWVLSKEGMWRTGIKVTKMVAQYYSPNEVTLYVTPETNLETGTMYTLVGLDDSELILNANL